MKIKVLIAIVVVLATFCGDGIASGTVATFKTGPFNGSIDLGVPCNDIDISKPIQRQTITGENYTYYSVKICGIAIGLSRVDKDKLNFTNQYPTSDLSRYLTLSGADEDTVVAYNREINSKSWAIGSGYIPKSNSTLYVAACYVSPKSVCNIYPMCNATRMISAIETINITEWMLNGGWEKTFGQDDNDCSGIEALQTSDGGYIVMGNVGDSIGYESKIWLIRTDANGTELWNKTLYKKWEPLWDYLNESWSSSIQQTSDGGYIIAGSAFNQEAESAMDALLIKVDANGNELWNKTFSGNGWGDDELHSVQQTDDGGYILTGQISNDTIDVWLIKTDENGNELWNRSFNGPGNDYGFSVQKANDGGYLILGETSPLIGESSSARLFGYLDAWLIKTDSNGSEQWNKTLGGSNNDYGNFLIKTRDGNYAFTGRTSDKYGNSLIWLIKISAEGKEIWNKTLGWNNNIMTGSQLIGEGRYVQQTADGGYIVVSGLDEHVMLVKADANGNQQWIKHFDNKYGESVQQTDDRGYIISGTSYNGHLLRDKSIWLAKTDSSGNLSAK